ncbi:MAG: GYF domain-containing protein [Thermoanaerobaculia bacterium]
MAAWYLMVDGKQEGPRQEGELEGLRDQGILRRATLVWQAGQAEWKPASEIRPDLFPPRQWYLATGGGTAGPFGADELADKSRRGELTPATSLWKTGMASWLAAGELPETASLFAPGAAAPATPAGAHSAPPPPRAPSDPLLHRVGAKLSELGDVPTISNVPIREVLLGGLAAGRGAPPLDVEEQLAVGTGRTTPALAQVATGWVPARLFWRALAASVGVYALLRLGYAQFHNSNLLPGMVLVGSFAVPLSVVILFFELNSPRNVSVYQVMKMLLVGGVVSLLVTLVVFRFFPDATAGEGIIPAVLVGVCEETGKALALLMLIGVARYRFQMNGLLFGSAVGAGFAGFESAGYAFRFGRDTAVDAMFTALQQGADGQTAFAFGQAAGVDEAVHIIFQRGVLAPGGHVIWTALVGSALWKVKGDRKFELAMLFHPLVLRRWAIAVVLHGIWDMALPIPDWIVESLLIVVGWYFVFAVLKQALDEIEQARVQALGTVHPAA